jgi:FAD/FMN-containing dehydrogenase
MNGRPHWAKNWQYIDPPVKIAGLYPADNLKTFKALRNRLDPDGAFTNPFLQQQLFS